MAGDLKPSAALNQIGRGVKTSARLKPNWRFKKMFTVKFRVDVVHDHKAMAETGDSETSAYLVFEKQFKTKQAAEKWCLEHFDVQDEFRSGQYFVSPTPYGAGHDAAIFSIEIAEEDCGGLKP